MNTNQFLARFNQSVDHWIDALEAYTIDIFRQKPHPDTWSLGQVYVHIADDTSWFAAQIKIASESSDNSHESMRGKGGWLFEKDGRLEHVDFYWNVALALIKKLSEACNNS